MDSPDMDDIVPGVGHFLGYDKLDLTNCNISSIQELVYQIGLLFSYTTRSRANLLGCTFPKY